MSIDAEAATAVVWRAIATLRAFTSWAVVQGYLQELPTADVSGPQTPAWEPRWLDRKDERALVRAVERYGNPRDVALIATLLQAGLRVGELVALELEDVELSPRKGAVTVRQGKRDRHRDVPLNAEARRELEQYLAVRPTSSSPRLFLGQRVVRKYALLARLDEVTPHTLRHTFAKRVLEGGAPAVTGARLLGRGSVETTAIYTQPGWEDRVEAVEQRRGTSEM